MPLAEIPANFYRVCYIMGKVCTQILPTNLPTPLEGMAVPLVQGKLSPRQGEGEGLHTGNPEHRVRLPWPVPPMTLRSWERNGGGLSGCGQSADKKLSLCI